MPVFNVFISVVVVLPILPQLVLVKVQIGRSRKEKERRGNAIFGFSEPSRASF